VEVFVDRSQDEDFAAFVDRDAGRLLRVARVLSGNEHDAWDLTQDCLVLVHRHWKRIDLERGAYPYARKVLVNLNVSRARRRRREVLMEAVPDVVGDTGDRGLEPWMEAAVQELPAMQRAAVTLFYLEDLPVEETAAVLGCSKSSVKTHLRRARETLRAQASRHQQPGAYHPQPDQLGATR
jgi:RNA polymerase sigma-70 factor (sigma-E family)